MGLGVDFHKNLVQVPSPIEIGAHLLGAFSADLGGEQWAKTAPPETDRLAAIIDATFV